MVMNMVMDIVVNVVYQYYNDILTCVSILQRHIDIYNCMVV